MFSDLRNTLITGGTFVHTVQGNDNNTRLLSEGFKILHNNIAPGAMHNSANNDLFEQPKCHPKTRLAVLNIINQWIQNLDGGGGDSGPSGMMWLYGSRGIGKTTIARSICEHCEELGLLLATFFFSRNVRGRNGIKQFVSTLAYQLTQTIPSTLQYIGRAVEKDPSVFDKTLKHQVQTLIVHPLKLCLSNFNKHLSSSSSTPTSPYLLVIDGLDECDDALAHIQVLKILGSLLLQHQLPLKILIISRPERHIRSAFETGSLCKLSTILGLDDSDSFKPDEDIRLFLSSEFDDIKETHPFRSRILISWPCNSIIEGLVKGSAGRFAVAAALIRFVASFDHLPHDRLKELFEFYEDDCNTPTRLLDLFLDDRRPPASLVLSNLPNSYASEFFSSPSDKKLEDSHQDFSFRRRSVSPLPTTHHHHHHSSNTQGFERASSEPSSSSSTATGFLRSVHSLSRRHTKRSAAFSCPIPGCGAIFTRHLNFKIHLRAHKEENKNNSRYSPSRCSYSGHNNSKLYHERHLQSFECMGCKRQFPQLDALDRHLNSEIGVGCMKVVVEVAAAQSFPDGRHCGEMELVSDTMEMDVEVDKAWVGTTVTEMEVD